MSCIKKWEATIWLPAGTKVPTTTRPSGIVRKLFKAMGSFVSPTWHVLQSSQHGTTTGIMCGGEESVGYNDEENHEELVELVRSVLPKARVESCWLNVEDAEWDAQFDSACCLHCGAEDSFEDGVIDRCGDCGADREGNLPVKPATEKGGT